MRWVLLFLAMGGVGWSLTAMSSSSPVAADSGTFETFVDACEAVPWGFVNNLGQDDACDLGQAIPVEEDSPDVLDSEPLVLDFSSQVAREAHCGESLDSPLQLRLSLNSLVSQHVCLQI
jgi:hypothetical protein